MEDDKVPAVPKTSILLGGRGVDGGVDGPGEPASTWREAVAVAKVIPPGLGLGLASDPRLVVDRIAGLGIDEVLVRCEWARVEPFEGFYDPQELDRLGALVASIKAAGMSVGVILGDGAAPLWLGPEAWLLPSTPDRFARYGASIIEALGGQIDVVVTVEEPGSWCLAAMLFGAAPPFRIGAVRDAVAGLDAMLAAHLMVARSLKQTSTSIEATWLASTDAGRLAEAVVLDEADDSGVATAALRGLVSRSPGRTAELLAEGVVSPPAVLPFGTEGPVPINPLGVMGWAAARRLSTLPTEAATVARPGRGLRLIHTDAVVDERGRVSRLRGHRRLDAITAGLEASRDFGVTRFIVGEATDRWRWGSFRHREGIFGVDRRRGPQGFEVLASDSAGVEAAEALRIRLGG